MAGELKCSTLHTTELVPAISDPNSAALRYIFTFLAILHIPGIWAMQVAQTITLAKCHTCSLLEVKTMSLSGLRVPSRRKMCMLVRPQCCLWAHILHFQTDSVILLKFGMNVMPLHDTPIL